MFRIVELEYPCFDTDLISPSSMTKGKEKLPCVLNDVSVYLHSSCASRVSRCIGVTGLTISQISERLLRRKKSLCSQRRKLILLNFPIYVVMKTCENLFRNLIKFNMTSLSTLPVSLLLSTDRQVGR